MERHPILTSLAAGALIAGPGAANALAQNPAPIPGHERTVTTPGDPTAPEGTLPVQDGSGVNPAILPLFKSGSSFYRSDIHVKNKDAKALVNTAHERSTVSACKAVIEDVESGKPGEVSLTPRVYLTDAEKRIKKIADREIRVALTAAKSARVAIKDCLNEKGHPEISVKLADRGGYKLINSAKSPDVRDAAEVAAGKTYDKNGNILGKSDLLRLHNNGKLATIDPEVERNLEYAEENASGVQITVGGASHASLPAKRVVFPNQ